MYTPRALFSGLIVKICFFVFSLYTIGRLATHPYEISFESPSLQIRDRGQSMVCVHTYSESDNALQRYGHLKVSKMAAGRHLGFDRTENGAVRSAVPENPTKHERELLTRCRVMAI